MSVNTTASLTRGQARNSANRLNVAHVGALILLTLVVGILGCSTQPRWCEDAHAVISSLGDEIRAEERYVQAVDYYGDRSVPRDHDDAHASGDPLHAAEHAMETAAVAGNRAALRLGLELETAEPEQRAEYAAITNAVAEDLEQAVAPLGTAPSPRDVRLAIAEAGLNVRYREALSTFIATYCSG